MLIQLEAEMGAQHRTVASLARALDEDRNTLRRWVKGERAMPLPIFTRILSELGIDPAVFMARARDRLPPPTP